MPIYDKPFSFDEMLRRTVFKGRPNFFNAKDFNKELLIIHRFIEEFNRVFAVHSTVEFSVPSFSETFNTGTNEFTRTINLNWTAGKVMYKGVEFDITASGVSGFDHVYTKPSTTTSPKEVKPPTYVILTGELDLVTYADNPTLCGIQSDEVPSTVPTVDVEQYTNLEIKLTTDPSAESNVLCVMATIHPRYKTDGSDDGFGFLYNTFKNPDFTLKNGTDNEDGVYQCNESLYEYLLERVIVNLSNVLNERQLIRRFNLADLENAEHARHNIGLSNIVNHRQLVQAENLRDLTNPALGRVNLGLGSSATANIGTGANDVAAGNILPVGLIAIWTGSPSSIPTGWKLCDGGNNTPDLRGRFVVGLKTNVTDFNLIGKAEDLSTPTIAKANLPNYSLPITQQPHKHTFYGPTWGNIYWDSYKTGNWDDNAKTNANAKPTNNTGNATIDITVNLGGGGQAMKVLPPYFTVAYIMYTGASITPPTPPTNPPPLTYPNFSTPTTGTSGTDGGYSSYTPSSVGGSGGVDVGSGIILTNPE